MHGPMSTRFDQARLARLLGGADLAALRQRLRRRYTRAATPEDGFTLSRLSPAERDALAGLLGRARRGAASMRLSHAALDDALRQAGLAPDLRRALECLDGPIIDHAARRERVQRDWQRLFAGLPPGALAEVLAEPAVQGLVKRLARRDLRRGEALLAQAQQVLARLPAPGISRSRLAAGVLGDAHGLDAGQPLATLLRRVLDPGQELPRQRDVWASQGVLVSELAKPVVALNLQTAGDSPVEHLLAIARTAGEPLHLSLRQLLRRPPQWQPQQQVYVCENPDVVAAAAQQLGAGCPPMISIDGQLSAAPRTLLDQLHAAGCQIHYHGDFDWPGITIGNGIMQRYGAAPWRFSAVDYAPVQGAELRGTPVAASWDAALAAKMQAAGLAVHEEACLSILLQDLGRLQGSPS